MNSRTSFNLRGEELRERAHEWYEKSIREQVEEGSHGNLLVINVDTGQYVTDTDDVRAAVLARERYPDAPLCAMRVGHPTAYTIGGSQHRASPPRRAR